MDRQTQSFCAVFPFPASKETSLPPRPKKAKTIHIASVMAVLSSL